MEQHGAGLIGLGSDLSQLSWWLNRLGFRSPARKPVDPLLSLAMPENGPPKLRVGPVLCRPCWATPALLGTQGQVFLKARRSKHRRRMGTEHSGDPSSSTHQLLFSGHFGNPSLVCQIPLHSFSNACFKSFNRPPPQLAFNFSGINGVSTIMPGPIGHKGNLC